MQLLHNKIYWLLLIFNLFAMRVTVAQEADIERLFEYPMDGDNNNELLDYIQNLQQQPLDLNRVTREELLSIPWVTPQAAQAILQYRKERHQFTDSDELDIIAELEPVTTLLKTFFVVKPKPQIQTSFFGRHRLVTGLQKSRGYKENIYTGALAKVYNKVGGKVFDQFQFALVTEKDPGEKSYYDFSGGYGEWFIPQLRARLVVGNYFIESGQGLVHHGAYRVNNGYEPVLAATPPGRGIKGTASVAENYGYCGGGMVILVGKAEIAAFYSVRPLDARVEADTIVSFPVSGYHRYGSEMSNRNAATEKAAGSYLKLPITQHIYLGVQGLYTSLNKPFVIERPAVRLTGDTYRVYGVDYKIFRPHWQIFGECAQSNHSGINHLHGILYRQPEFEYLALWRKYQPAFLNRHGGAFGESSDMANETGIYCGWKWRAARKTTLACYYDQYKRPYYANSALSALRGKELLVIIEHKFSSRLAGLLRGQLRSRDEMHTVVDSFGNSAKKIVSQTKYLLRTQIDYQPTRSLHLRSRFEYHQLGGNDYGLAANLDDSSAVMLYHDIHYQANKRFSLRARWTMFDSPLYDTAFYLYETDLPGVMRMKMLYRRGSRGYLLCGLKLNQSLQMTFKYEYTLYNNVNSIGSGYDLINSNHEKQISLQFDWRM